MRRHRRGVDEVLSDVKLKRKVRPSENFMAQLRVWGEVRYDVWTDEGKTDVPKELYAELLRE